MTFDRLHAPRRHQRRRMTLLVLVLAMAALIVVAHGAAGEGHMGHGTAMCLAVMSVGAAALGSLARELAQRLHTPLVALVPIAPALAVVTRPVLPRSRAGPAVLQVFLR